MPPPATLLGTLLAVGSVEPSTMSITSNRSSRNGAELLEDDGDALRLIEGGDDDAGSDGVPSGCDGLNTLLETVLLPSTGSRICLTQRPAPHGLSVPDGPVSAVSRDEPAIGKDACKVLSDLRLQLAPT